MATKKAGLGKGLDSLITNKVAPAKAVSNSPVKDEKSIEGILMRMLYLNYPNLSNSLVYYSHYLFKIKMVIMKLLPVNVDGVQQRWQA